MNVKKSRESRLTNRVSSPVAIKIEDDSDEENVVPNQNGRNVSVGSRNVTDKGVQTDNSYLTEMLKQLVSDRMKKYYGAIKNNEIKDRNIIPMLDKLKLENEELKLKMSAMQTQLDGKEKPTPLAAKRRYTAIEKQLQSKRTSVSSSSTRQSGTMEVLPRPPALETITPASVVLNHTRLPNHSDTTYTRPPPTSEHFPPPLLGNAQLPVNSNNQNSPAQQNTINPPFPLNDRFCIFNGQIIPRPALNMNGNISQVNSSNSPLMGLSAAPGVNLLRRPMEALAQTFGNLPPPNVPPPNVNAVNVNRSELSNPFNPLMDHQRMPASGTNPRPVQNGIDHQRMPVNVPNPRLVQNACRPPPLLPSQSQAGVPNIALPYLPLPKLTANITTSNNAIVLTWDYEKSNVSNSQYKVECYQLFAHQAKDSRSQPPVDIRQWKKIGVVNALPLPMACTLTQFASGSVYHFAVVALDIHGREGEMSNPCVIRLDVNR